MFNNSTSTVALCHDDGLLGLETSSEKEYEFSEPLTCQALDTEIESVYSDKCIELDQPCDLFTLFPDSMTVTTQIWSVN